MGEVQISSIWPEWRQVELLGEGSFAKVYRAVRHEHDHVSESAIKIIEIPRDRSEIAALEAARTDEHSIRRHFEKRAREIFEEVIAMESLKSAPNVVTIEDYKLVPHIHDVGWTILIRMELLEPLSAFFKDVDFPGTKEVVRLGIDMCRALQCCHDKALIHRDIKPGNMFRSEYGYKLGDFGVARKFSFGMERASTITGSWPYMAPEIYRNERYGKTADIYSLGLVLYHYLNGKRRPFLPAIGSLKDYDIDAALVRRFGGEQLPAPGFADAQLAEIVLRACAFDPKARWQSAKDMLEALEGWQKSEESGSGRSDSRAAEVQSRLRLPIVGKEREETAGDEDAEELRNSVFEKVPSIESGELRERALGNVPPIGLHDRVRSDVASPDVSGPVFLMSGQAESDREGTISRVRISTKLASARQHRPRSGCELADGERVLARCDADDEDTFSLPCESAPSPSESSRLRISTGEKAK